MTFVGRLDHSRVLMAPDAPLTFSLPSRAALLVFLVSFSLKEVGDGVPYFDFFIFLVGLKSIGFADFDPRRLDFTGGSDEGRLILKSVS